MKTNMYEGYAKPNSGSEPKAKKKIFKKVTKSRNNK
jgi:hypothetical protein